MLKKLQNLLGEGTENSIVPGIMINQDRYFDIFNSPLELADSLWKKGEIQQAINLYRDEIQKNPNTKEIRIKLAKLLYQQRNISESYQKFAASFKKQGNPHQAAEYYRQAITIESLIRSSNSHNTTQKSVDFNFNSSSLMHNLSDSAFSFVPLLQSTDNLRNTQEKLLEPQVLSTQKSYTYDVSSQNPDVSPSQNTNIAWETIQLYAEQALDGYDNSQWQETVDACQKILEIAPEMAEAHKILGNALQRMGETSRAMDCYAKALKIQPDLAIVYAGIGKLYYEQQKWSKAKEYYQKATIINPQYSEAYHKLANIWQQLEQPGKAEFCLNRAANLEKELSNTSSPSIPQLTLLPNSPKTPQTIETYYKLAQNLEQNQKWQEAAFHYRKAVELNKIYLNSTANNHLKAGLTKLSSQTSASRDQLVKAIKFYQDRAEIKPSSAKIQFDLGNLYAKNQQWSEAITSYQQAIKIEPTHGAAHISLGKALAQVGRQIESVEQFYLGYTVKPELADPDSLFNLGKDLVKQGDRKRAINCYTFVIDLKPDFVPAYHNLAETLIQLGRRQEAIDCYRKAVEYNPRDTDSYFALGEQHTINRQWDNAVEAYRQVLELQPKYPQASYKLSYALSAKIKSELADK